MSIESPADLAGLRVVGRSVALVLDEMEAAIAPGVSTAQIDAVAAAAMRRLGVRSAPRHTYGFPGHTCISVNDEIVHGVPGPRRLRGGDVVKIDVTAEAGGYVADAARTVIVGRAPAAAERLCVSAVAALQAALAAARACGAAARRVDAGDAQRRAGRARRADGDDSRGRSAGDHRGVAARPRGARPSCRRELAAAGGWLRLPRVRDCGTRAASVAAAGFQPRVGTALQDRAARQHARSTT